MLSVRPYFFGNFRSFGILANLVHKFSLAKNHKPIEFTIFTPILLKKLFSFFVHLNLKVHRLSTNNTKANVVLMYFFRSLSWKNVKQKNKQAIVRLILFYSKRRLVAELSLLGREPKLTRPWMWSWKVAFFNKAIVEKTG